MTQAELEQIARAIRARGLHSSWDELLAFSESVVGSLADAYRALLRNSVSPGTMPSASPGNLPVLLQEKLGKALVSLTSQEQVTKWASEALANNIADISENPKGDG